MPAQPVKERLVNEDGENVVVERDPYEGGSLIERVEAAKSSEPVGSVEPEETTREELYERAQELDVQGRSKMNKEELAEAVAEAEAQGDTATQSEEDAEPAEEIGPEDGVEGADQAEEELVANEDDDDDDE